jgi:glycine/serine hydroxymethyltransferase
MAGGHPRGLTHSHTLVVDLRKRTILEGKRVGRKMNANQKTIFRKKEIKRKNSPCVLISSQNYEYEFRI